MIEDVGRIRSRRNSALAEDIEGFSLEENPAIKPLDSDNRRYSSYLTPEDAWRSERRPPLRHSRSMEVLTEFSQPEKDKVGLVYQSRQNNDLEEQIQSANPWVLLLPKGVVRWDQRRPGDGAGRGHLSPEVTGRAFEQVGMDLRQ